MGSAHVAMACSISLKFGTDFCEATPDLQQRFKVKRSNAKVTQRLHFIIRLVSVPLVPLTLHDKHCGTDDHDEERILYRHISIIRRMIGTGNGR